ncbi:hypothetical protein [Sphingomonas jaspsi]|uniref:hypothetical protein n=1 Tax=Sphingomonas jaspsi TaxID=392409 RepID=UPI0004AF805F|nr:hypothetical protein [Sphingomonas jaspsi]
MMPIQMLLMAKRASTALDTQTVVAGSVGTTPNRTRGFTLGGVGTCTDGTSALYGEATINGIYHDEATNSLIFEVAGVRANSGWTTMTIKNGATVVATVTRASATFTSPSYSRWTWAGVANPWTNGQSRTVEFT